LLAFAGNWRKKKVSQANPFLPTHDREFQTIVWLALGYSIGKIGLVILVEPPIDRYCAPATVFLASIIVMTVCRLILPKREWQ
jgi:hypothetical protein